MRTSDTASKSSAISLYLFAGLAFLLWENLVSSFVGHYHLELRRTIWGVIYYCLLFLIFGGFVEVVNFIYSRLFPGRCWSGQRYLWLLTALAVIVWGDISRQLLMTLFGISSVKWSYAINLVPLAFVGLIGLLGNIYLARLERTDKLPDPHRLRVYFFTAFLYILISTKVTYRYFQYDMFATPNLLLQPAFIIGVPLLAYAMVRLFTSIRAFRRALIIVPLVLTLAVVGLSAGYKTISKAAPRPAQPPSDHPNIIILLFDALRADHVSACESQSSLTPTIDSLAREGKAYPRCYSTSSWTFPAVVSLLTSKLPNKLGLVNARLVPERIPTMVDILRKNGYYTAAFSANDNFSPLYGFDRSFDEFRLLRGKGERQLLFPFQLFPLPFSQGFIRFFVELAYQLGFRSVDSVTGDWRDMNRNAYKMLSKDITKPFFIYMHYIEPHFPNISKPFRDGILDLEMLTYTFQMGPGGYALDFDKSIIDAEVLEKMHRRYVEGVQSIDLATAEMVYTVEQLGLAENTIFIIIADHGQGFMDHGQIGHRNSLFEELVRIPLIIYIPPELRIELPDQPCGVSLLDIAPTVLDLAGINEEIPDQDGWPLSEHYPDDNRPKYMLLNNRSVSMNAIVLEPYKLIIIEYLKSGQVDTLLFNLNNDNEEKVNLYPGEKYIADSLAVYLQEQLEQTITAPQGTPRALTPQEIQRLRALGYVN